MKKIYIKPSAEVVTVKLWGSVLDDPNPGVGDWSKYTNTGDAKEQHFYFDEEEEVVIAPTNTALWGDDEEEEW